MTLIYVKKPLICDRYRPRLILHLRDFNKVSQKIVIGLLNKPMSDVSINADERSTQFSRGISSVDIVIMANRTESLAADKYRLKRSDR